MIRRCFSVSLLALAALVVASAASAQIYPTRPVRIVVGSPVGSAADLIARIYADKLCEYFGRRFVIDNLPAEGEGRADLVASEADADGYTLYLANDARVSGATIAPPPRARLDAFDPVTLLATAPTVLAVTGTLDATSVPQFLSVMAGQPERLRYAAGGAGSHARLAAELFADATGARLDPVRDTATSEIAALIAGRVSVVFAPLPALIEYVSDRRVAPLAVFTGARSRLAPGIPTYAESGRAPIEIVEWYGLMAPKGTPLEIKRELAHAVTRAMRDRAFRTYVTESGAEPIGAALDAFEAFLEAAPPRRVSAIEASARVVE